MRHDLSRNRLIRRAGAVTLAALLLALAGCGGGHDDDNAGNNNGAQADSFISQVNAVINSTSETGDPIATDGITATTPEQSEPVPLG